MKIKSKSRKSIFNLATSIFYKAVVIAVGLVLPKLFITMYGSEINGLQNSVRQIFAYIALLEAGIGASTIQSMFKPVASGDRDKVNSYLSAASSYYNKIGFIYFGVLAVISAIYCFAVPVSTMDRLQVFLYIMVSGALTGINFFYIAKIKLLVSAEGDEYLVSIITTVTFTVTSLIKILLIFAGCNIVLLETVYLLLNASVTVIYYFVAKKKYPWISLKAAPDYSCVAQSRSVMVHKITSVIFQNTDVILLTFFCDLYTVSIYSMYKMVTNMVNSLTGTFGDSINFVLGQQFNSANDENHDYYKRFVDVFNIYYSALSFGLFTVTYIFLIPFLRIYTANADINYIYDWMPFLYIIIEILMVGREAMMRTINVAGHFKKTQWRSVIEAGLNIVCSILFILLFKSFMGNVGGLYGALLGTVVALLYRTIDINIYANKHILFRSSFKTFKIMVTNFLVFIVIAVVFYFYDLQADNYLTLVINAVWITAVVLAVFFATQSLFNIKEFKAFKNYLKKRFLHKK